MPTNIISCDRCNMVSINGINCHEHRCPNENSRYDTETDIWVKQYKCFICGDICDVDYECCPALDD